VNRRPTGRKLTPPHPVVLDRITWALPLTVTISGRPASKKNNRVHVPVVRKDGRTFTKPIPNAAYRQWLHSLRTILVLRGGGAAALPHWDIPLRLDAVFFEHPMQRGDLFGYLDALADGLQDVGVITNDRLFRALGDCRVERDRDHPRVTFTLTPLESWP
jgi:hypothetical protein